MPNNRPWCKWGGIGVNGLLTNALPSSGVTFHVGLFGKGGVLGKGSMSVLTEISKPSNITLSGGLGLGDGTSGGLMTCQQYTLCTPGCKKD